MSRNEFSDAKRPIDGKALWVYLLLHWKSLLCVAVVFGMLGLGRNYINTRGTGETTAKVSDSSFYDEQLDSINKEIDQKKAYMSESIMGKIDDDHQGSASATLWVEDGNSASAIGIVNSEEEGQDAKLTYQPVNDNAYTVVQSLSSYLASGFDWNALKDDFDVSDGKYLQEMVTVEENGDSLSLSVEYTSKEEAEKLLDDVLSALQSRADEVISSSSVLSGCTVNILNKASSDTVSVPSAQWVSEQIKALKDLYDQRSVLSDLQSNNSNQGTTAAAGFSMKAGIKAGIKFAVLGVVLYVLLLILKLLCGGRVLTAREVNECYKTESLAVMARKENKRTALDRKILSIDGENMVSLSDEESLEAAGLQLAAYAGKKYALIGDVKKDVSEHTASLLAKYSGKEVVSLDNVLGSLEARKILNDCDGVILAVERSTSRYRTLNAELSLSNKPLAGTIVY